MNKSKVGFMKECWTGLQSYDSVRFAHTDLSETSDFSTETG